MLAPLICPTTGKSVNFSGCRFASPDQKTADIACASAGKALVRAGSDASAGSVKARAFLRAARVARRFAPDETEGLLARAYAADPGDKQIAALYEVLLRMNPSPVVELNRAVAVAMAFGPAAGLELIDALIAEPYLKSYHLLPSVRGDLLFKLGRFAEAQAEFARAATLTRNARERNFLLERAQACT